eukprot:TRINITY_DN58819_c0_g1_i2.p1 TRINITY_DN58819_c0_g1~~TRINITY_DN58819_c0_g1_i2.p1  ORF type:complete len:604 (+),score=101.62 TRINITY_DN58819_c0_g1_i2:88-1899(+)
MLASSVVIHAPHVVLPASRSSSREARLRSGNGRRKHCRAAVERGCAVGKSVRLPWVAAAVGCGCQYWRKRRTTWRRRLCKTVMCASGDQTTEPAPRVAVVGAGLAGLGAALASARAGLRVTLLDAAPKPPGVVFKSKDGLPLEFGQKGIWYEYPNLLALIDEVVPGGQQAALTPPTPSGFWSERGLESSAPIFSRLPSLPTPLGSLAYTAPSFQFLGLGDRLTAVPLITPLLKALEGSEADRQQLDNQSAAALFAEYGVSDNLRRSFLDPLLKALIFRPPEQLSALIVLEVLWSYALKTQNSFDVRWFRGSLDEVLIAPIVSELRRLGVEIQSGARVTDLAFDEVKQSLKTIKYRRSDGEEVELAADGCVLATGVSGLKRIASASPELRRLSPEVDAVISGLRAVDCTAVRLLLDQRCPSRFASNVIANMPGLGDMGGTYFVLERTQPQFRTSRYRGKSLVAVDLYGSEELREDSDEAVVERAMSFLEQAESAVFRRARPLQSTVLRAREAATEFAPVSLKSRPTQQTSVRNLFLAGDFVRGLDCSAGLSQERALCAGYAAANMFMDSLSKQRGAEYKRQEISSALPDESHVAALRSALRGMR